jgi:hypothetical protein
VKSKSCLALLALMVLAVAAAPAASDVHEDDPFDRLASLMQQAERHLREGRTGPPVQGVQAQVVSELDELIAALESRQQRPGGSAGAGARQEGAQQTGRAEPGGVSEATGPPAEESSEPEGQWRGEAPREGAPTGEAWRAALPPSERQKVEQAFRERRLPLRYRDLIEKYSRSLANEE